MEVSKLKKDYHLFGNKGNFWNNSAHIARNSDYLTLCGTPMLSNNWARIEKMKFANCPKCNRIYAELEKETA